LIFISTTSAWPQSGETSAPPTDAEKWSILFRLLLVIVFVVIPMVIGAFIARRKKKNPLLWAALCGGLSYIGVLTIFFVEETEPRLPRKLRMANAVARATGRIDKMPSAIGGYNAAKWRTAAGVTPELTAIAARFSEAHGPYFGELFAAHYMAWRERRSIEEIAQMTSDEARAFEQRRREREHILSEARATTATLDKAQAKVKKIFASAYGFAAELKDGTAVVDIDGKVGRFLSMPTYRDAYSDREPFAPVANEEDRKFILTKITQAGGLNLRAKSRAELF